MSLQAKEVFFEQTGKPEEVLGVRTVEEPVPGPGELVVRMRFAPINPADINFIEGNYGKMPELPCVPGSEGVGSVQSLGGGVEGVSEGDLVIVPAGAGAWRTHLRLSASDVVRLPGDIDPRQAAMLRVNPPTAYRMLRDFVHLEPGDWVIQNAANSGVGMSVVAIARRMGLRTVNVVRREELFEPLREAGADVVITDSRDDFKSVAERTGGAKIRLGLNAVGGDNALGVAGCLAHGGVHVTYGAMSKQALKVPNSFLIFKDIAFRGFWVTRWFETAGRDELDTMFGELAAMVSAGDLEVPVASEFAIGEVANAVRLAQTDARGGKVLLNLQPS